MHLRQQTIGVKQVIRLTWMDKTASLLLSGLPQRAVREALREFMVDRLGNGKRGQRSLLTREFVVTTLMRAWGAAHLAPLREASLAYLRQYPHTRLPIHWAMMSAAYPFWFNTARQTGRLLALQNQVTRRQIIDRLKAQYGDRQTVSRSAQCVIRSFVAWGVIRDCATRGCYEKAPLIHLTSSDLTGLLIESAIHATLEGRGALEVMINSPAFFPFRLPALSGEGVSRTNHRIDVIRHGVSQSLLLLKR